MQLDLDDHQTEVLRDVLDITLRDLSYEIASADLPTYRDQLRARRQTLATILATIGGPYPTAQRFDD